MILHSPWKALEPLLGQQRREHKHHGCLSCAAVHKPLVSLLISPAVCSSAKSSSAQKKGTFCCFFKCLGFYCVQISKWTAWVLTNAAACSQGKSPFIYRLFKDKEKLYLYNPPAHSLTNSYLPQPHFRRTIYETLKENTQLSHRLLAGRSWDATGSWRWQNHKCIKKDFSLHHQFAWMCVQEAAQDI